MSTQEPKPAAPRETDFLLPSPDYSDTPIDFGDEADSDAATGKEHDRGERDHIAGAAVKCPGEGPPP
jgi:hypothetical protein